MPYKNPSLLGALPAQPDLFEIPRLLPVGEFSPFNWPTAATDSSSYVRCIPALNIAMVGTDIHFDLEPRFEGFRLDGDAVLRTLRRFVKDGKPIGIGFFEAPDDSSDDEDIEYSETYPGTNWLGIIAPTKQDILDFSQAVADDLARSRGDGAKPNLDQYRVDRSEDIRLGLGRPALFMITEQEKSGFDPHDVHRVTVGQCKGTIVHRLGDHLDFSFHGCSVHEAARMTRRLQYLCGTDDSLGLAVERVKGKSSLVAMLLTDEAFDDAVSAFEEMDEGDADDEINGEDEA